MSAVKNVSDTVGEWKEPDKKSDVFNNPHVHVMDDFVYMDDLSMALESEAFYNNIRQTEVLWTRTIPSLHHYFIGGGTIFGVSAAINLIKSDPLVSSKFKKDYLVTINIDKDIYKAWSTLLVEHKKNSAWFKRQSCMQIMKVCKAMGNELYKIGGLYRAAYNVYYQGILHMELDHDEVRHCGCKGKQHDILLAQLYNNVAAALIKVGQHSLAMRHCRCALMWHKNYSAALAKMQYIAKFVPE